MFNFRNNITVNNKRPYRPPADHEEHKYKYMFCERHYASLLLTMYFIVCRQSTCMLTVYITNLQART